MGEKNPRLLRITTVPISLKLLLAGQLNFFKTNGFEVLAVSGDGPEIVNNTIDGTPHIAVPMTRRITPIQDLICLYRLVRIIKWFQPDIVHTHTPKAGLLGMMAARICGVPIRMHTVAGLPLMEKTGALRWLLIQVERLAYRCATNVYPNSEGLKNFIENSITDTRKLKIIGNGSSNGIDTTYFSRNESLENQAAAIRTKHGIARGDIVFSFVGRVVKDKGISELAGAFRKFRQDAQLQDKVFLLIVGPLEQDLDPLDGQVLQFLTNDDHVTLAGYQSDVRPWLMASDIFVFPSYREGFPNVVMQAGCLGIPSIVSDINGCNEIVENGQTGIIVKPKDESALYSAMQTLADSEPIRSRLASGARQKIQHDFDQRYVWEQLRNEYYELLGPGAAFREGRVFYRKVIKPFFDKVIALLVLVVLSPVMLICMIALAAANDGKVWFTQWRPGKNGKLFKLIKFRTMNEARDASGALLADDQRLHDAGKFIRRTSLDELPQLINVLKGDMSIVGPRPLLEEYLPLYTREQAQRHQVKPGITGWAQVNGRNAISWQKKFEYDVWYVKNQSFLLDLKILIMTVRKVFKAEGISSATSVTMEKFRGNSGGVGPNA
jgi:lipopolysaccharide/colanic/teichoic acid biosynthesis glycosyltransferase/glycosyltransferase involved in cell wall biosynthesis